MPFTACYGSLGCFSWRRSIFGSEIVEQVSWWSNNGISWLSIFLNVFVMTCSTSICRKEAALRQREVMGILEFCSILNVIVQLLWLSNLNFYVSILFLQAALKDAKQNNMVDKEVASIRSEVEVSGNSL